MNPIETLSLVLGAGFSSGLNLYATIATLGLLERFGVIHLPPQLQILSHPAVLAIAGVLYVMEFLADKVPYVDSVWQAVHTFIRPPAAALLAFSATAAAPEAYRAPRFRSDPGPGCRQLGWRKPPRRGKPEQGRQ